MPSGHKKRKSAKRKNKASTSPPHQGWFRPHTQMLKEPSFGNGPIGKEKHNIPLKEVAGNGDIEKGEENIFFEFKGGKVASGSEMDALGNEGNQIPAIVTAGIPSDDENPQKVDVLKMSALDKIVVELQETEKSELLESNGFSEESVTSDAKVGWSGGSEETDREDNDTKEIEANDSLEDDLTSPVKIYVSVTEEGEAGQAAAKKEEVVLAHEVDVSSCKKEDNVVIDAHGSMEAPQDNERDAITPKIEIPHPPMTLRRASMWNCCGLLEVFKTSQH